jgi:hypothetical protein
MEASRPHFKTTRDGISSLDSKSAKLVCASKTQADYAQRCAHARRDGRAITQRKSEDGGWEMRIVVDVVDRKRRKR